MFSVIYFSIGGVIGLLLFVWLCSQDAEVAKKQGPMTWDVAIFVYVSRLCVAVTAFAIWPLYAWILGLGAVYFLLLPRKSYGPQSAEMAGAWGFVLGMSLLLFVGSMVAIGLAQYLGS